MRIDRPLVVGKKQQGSSKRRKRSTCGKTTAAATGHQTIHERWIPGVARLTCPVKSLTIECGCWSDPQRLGESHPWKAIRRSVRSGRVRIHHPSSVCATTCHRRLNRVVTIPSRIILQIDMGRKKWALISGCCIQREQSLPQLHFLRLPAGFPGYVTRLACSSIAG